MLCYVMLCYVTLYYVMLYYIMLCYVMSCYVMLLYIMLCYVMLCYIMLCSDLFNYISCTSQNEYMHLTHNLILHPNHLPNIRKLFKLRE